jgi:hypothetical protein
MMTAVARCAAPQRAAMSPRKLGIQYLQPRGLITSASDYWVARRAMKVVTRRVFHATDSLVKQPRSSLRALAETIEDCQNVIKNWPYV